jgi:REP element-mobilizing transposase RayT
MYKNVGARFPRPNVARRIVMPYNPYIHHRRSIRLQGYDYSQNGCYFITICTQDHISLFGKVYVGKMIKNIYGNMVEHTWKDLTKHNHHVKLDEFIVMPNHIHGIVILDNNFGLTYSGAGLEPAPTNTIHKYHGIPEIVRQLKTFSARHINKIRNSPGDRVWQRNYYERIIRNEREYLNVVKYIIENPLKWDSDKNNPENL